MSRRDFIAIGSSVLVSILAMFLYLFTQTDMTAFIMVVTLFAGILFGLGVVWRATGGADVL